MDTIFMNSRNKNNKNNKFKISTPIWNKEL